jgi:hypothetical protein
VAAAASRLLAEGRLTAAGRRFTGALLDEVRPWLDEVAPPRIVRLARLANADHYVRWRLRNMRPSADGLVAAFRRGDPPPVSASELVVEGARALSHSPRLRDIHRWLRAGGPVDNKVEAALLAGDHGTVRQAYTGTGLDRELTALVLAAGVGDRAEEVAALVAAGGDPVRVVDWIVG